ncbi:MAG TPA: phosphoadenylyl-sulfate reductase [Xanthomonadales bacterium]|nr:phosphoadenylyl-sulfate reductase [Xanthomonadales bacterium]
MSVARPQTKQPCSQRLELAIPRPGQTWSTSQLELINPCLENMQAAERVEWALNFLPDQPVLTSSFGAQSAVMLHLVTRIKPDIPVVLIDTGYLFPETYDFIDQLSERLELNLRIFRPNMSPSWQERRYGKMWEEGADGIKRYNRINKVEPMREALETLQVGTWFSGLRRIQSESRADTPVLLRQGPAVKVHPLADWSDRDVHFYLKKHNLPYHPLWDQGYVSIGDVHTTRPLTADITEEQTRFFGLLRECGINEPEQFEATDIQAQA